MFVNKIYLKNFMSGLIFIFLTFFTINFQTTIWFDLFGYFPAPNLWLPLMIYLIMYRSFPLNLFWLFLFFFTIATITSAIPFYLFLSLFTLYGLVLFAQKRFSLLTMSDFILLTTSSLICFPLIYFLFTLLHNSSTPLDIFGHLSTFFVTLPIIPPLLIVLQNIDSLLKSNEPHYDRFGVEL